GPPRPADGPPAADGPAAADPSAPVRSLERLAVVEALPHLLPLGAAPPLPFSLAAGLAAGRRGVEVWRLTLTRPLREGETLALATTLPAFRPAADGERFPWDVPLLTLPGADRVLGEVRLYAAGTVSLPVRAEGLTEAEAGAAGAAPARPGRAFRYDDALAPGQTPRLRLGGLSLPPDRLPDEVCEDARLTTRVGPQGRLVHHFHF